MRSIICDCALVSVGLLNSVFPSSLYGGHVCAKAAMLHCAVYIMATIMRYAVSVGNCEVSLSSFPFRLGSFEALV